MNGKSVCGRFLSRASLMTEDKNFFFAKFFVAGSFLQKTASTAIDVDVARALERLRRAQRRLDFFSNTSQNKRRTSCNGSSRSYEMLPNSKKTAIPAHPPTYPPPAPWAPTPSPVRLLVANFLPILIARSFLLCTSCEASIASDFVGAYVAVVVWACGECIKCCCCRCCFCAAAATTATTSSSCSVCVLHCSVQFLRKVGGIKVFAIAPNFCKKNDKNGRISFSEVYSPFYRSSANQNEDTFSCEKYG